MATEDTATNDRCPTDVPQEVRQSLTRYQNSLATEAEAYRQIAAHVKNSQNRDSLLKISEEILEQAYSWKSCTDTDPEPNMRRVHRYVRTSRLMGFTFAVKLMDKRKRTLRSDSKQLADQFPQIANMQEIEEKRDQKLFDMLDEKRLSYVGAMILGMNDAIVEITGTLAGLTLAMQNTRLIALSGLITGIAATLSMAASEFLAVKSDGRDDAKRSALYTGVAYLITVVLLIAPYVILDDSMYLLAMGVMLVMVVVILAAFNYYTSIAQDIPFGKRFGQMIAISFGVAALSFVLGLFVKTVLGVDV